MWVRFRFVSFNIRFSISFCFIATGRPFESEWFLFRFGVQSGDHKRPNGGNGRFHNEETGRRRRRPHTGKWSKSIAESISCRTRNNFHFVAFQCAQLFFEQLVPEWALLIFMKRYQLTRTDALEQIIKHEKAYSLNVPTDFDRFSLDQWSKPSISKSQRQRLRHQAESSARLSLIYYYYIYITCYIFSSYVHT